MTAEKHKILHIYKKELLMKCQQFFFVYISI